ncbi:hypothetical protein X732_30410 [Mesorhizobium sp. L2C066B000]|nr:hypothetical protein X732_30410 [Mesorhizobium sp. L2C066B000]
MRLCRAGQTLFTECDDAIRVSSYVMLQATLLGLDDRIWR